MFIKQAELFWGLGHDFVEAVTNASRKEAFEADRLLFAEGEPARRFYTLLSGRVNLTVGDFFAHNRDYSAVEGHYVLSTRRTKTRTTS